MSAFQPNGFQPNAFEEGGIATSGAGSRSQTDTLTLSDTYAVAMAVGLAVTAQTLALSDAYAASMASAATGTITETLVLSDTQARGAANVGSIAETLALSDTYATGYAVGRSISDTLALSDTYDAQGYRGPIIANGQLTQYAWSQGARTSVLRQISYGSGEMLVVVLTGITDNAVLPGTISDIDGLAWTKRADATHSSGTYNGKITTVVWTAPTNASSTTDITISFSSATTSVVMYVFRVQGQNITVEEAVTTKNEGGAASSNVLAFAAGNQYRLFLGGAIDQGTIAAPSYTANVTTDYDRGDSGGPVSGQGIFHRYNSTTSAINLGDSYSASFRASAGISLYNNFSGATLEILTLTDTYAALLRSAGSQVDTLALTDTYARGATATVAQADTLAFSDQYAASIGSAGGAGFSDLLSFSDAFAAQARATAVQVDTLALSDVYGIGQAKTGTETDTLTLSDQYARAMVLATAQGDTLALSDQFAPAFAIAGGLTDILTLSDTFAVAFASASGAGFADTLTLSDQYGAAYITLSTGAFADTLVLSDAFATAEAAAKAQADTLTLSDIYSTSLGGAGLGRDEVDTLVLSDAYATAIFIPGTQRFWVWNGSGWV